MPPDPEPSRFSDWSSLVSPPARMSPPRASDVQAEQIGNIQNQLNMAITEATRPERVDISNSERVTIASQTEPLREHQDLPARPTSLNIETGTQRNDAEPSEENVHIIPPVPIRSARSSFHTDDVALIRITPQESSTNDDLSRSSQRRPHDINIKGISSICPVERILQVV